MASNLARMMASNICKLASVGWHPLKTDETGEVCGMQLPVGHCIWVEGELHGVPQSGWLCDGKDLIMLHGLGEQHDRTVDEFVQFAATPPVEEKPAVVVDRQRTLF